MKLRALHKVRRQVTLLQMETLKETSGADQAHLNTSVGASTAAVSPPGVTYGKGRRYSHREQAEYI